MIQSISSLLRFCFAFRHSAFGEKKNSLFSITRVCPFFPYDNNCLCTFLCLLNNSSQRLQLKSCSLTPMTVSLSLSLISFFPPSLSPSFSLSPPPLFNYAQCDFIDSYHSIFLFLSSSLFLPDRLMQPSSDFMLFLIFIHIACDIRATTSLSPHN